MKKVLFLVPHEDDELFVGGPMLINLVRSGKYEVSVFIATNGDYYPFESTVRARESIKVLRDIGVKDRNIYFGGYGDSWTDGHIYNKPGDEVQTSRAGRSETYMDVESFNEWHFIYTGEHSAYTRNNYRDDVKSLILSLMPDVIICVDMDANPDHRALSLFTDEALCEILIANQHYKPFLLKKYSYNGMLFGNEDYFSEYPNPETRKNLRSLENPYIVWNEGIRYSVPKDCNPLLLCNNYLNKLGRMYKSQEIMFNIGKFTNADVMYWKRNTGNLLLTADIKASSGNTGYLNDFKLIDSQDISVRDFDGYKLSWRPDTSDDEALIRIDFKNPVNISKLLLYYANKEGAQEAAISVRCYAVGDKAAYIRSAAVPHKGQYREQIEIESEIPISRIELIVSNSCGNIGLTEIEALEEDCGVPFEEFLYIAEPSKKVPLPVFKCIRFIERKYLSVKYIFYRYLDYYRRQRRRCDRKHTN